MDRGRQPRYACWHWPPAPSRGSGNAAGRSEDLSQSRSFGSFSKAVRGTGRGPAARGEGPSTGRIRIFTSFVAAQMVLQVAVQDIGQLTDLHLRPMGLVRLMVRSSAG